MSIPPAEATGPLDGIRIVELQGLGPAPFAAMLLGDLGAEVIRVDRLGGDPASSANAELDGLARGFLARGRRSVGIDVRTDGGRDLVQRLADGADVLIEGFRPGVMERLGLGPEHLVRSNPRLVYARVTGWGRAGAYAGTAGHDINYIALSGALWPVGRRGQAPVPPLAYLGDFGGGGMLLALGVCAALAERANSGAGQVVDASMVDGSALLSGFLHAVRDAGQWIPERGANVIDSGAPYYDTYATADGKWMAVGAIEPVLYRNLITTLGLAERVEDQNVRAHWPKLRAGLAAAFATRTRDEWEQLFDGIDACVTPVLTPWEAPAHPHHAARGTFTTVAGVDQPDAGPRFSRTPVRAGGPAPSAGADTDSVLAELGLTTGEIDDLRSAGAVA